jgi:hypothetical protein
MGFARKSRSLLGAMMSISGSKTEMAFYPRDFRFAPDKRTSREAEISLAAYR